VGVVAVGAAPNTFGVPGVRKHCLFLKQVADAMRFRERLSDALERASLPGLSDGRIREMLTFVVIGAGPTGVELCGELRDYVAQDVARLYPRLLPHVRIVLLEASDKVLGAFDADMQQAALRRLREGGRGVAVDVRTSAGVSEVRPTTIVLSDGEVLPYGVAVWAAGEKRIASRIRRPRAPAALAPASNAPLQTKRGNKRNAMRRRVVPTPSQVVVRPPRSIPFPPLHLAGIGTLEFVRETACAIPAQAEYAGRARGRLAVDAWMRVIGAPGMLAFGDCAHVASGDLPATAQVASQAGTFLGRLLTDGYLLDTDNAAPPLPDGAPGARTLRSVLRGSSKGVAPPFRFLNLGILAYVGGSEALVQVDVGGQGAKLKNAGRIGFALWRSVYLSKQYGVRNRMLVAVDWFKARIFGRDISRL
jgi:NADH:ubiquinone reductase (non-electrogenic)